MNRIALWLQRTRGRWNGPGATDARPIVGLVVRLVWRLAAAVLWQLRVLFARLPARVRVGIVLVSLVLASRATASIAPSISETAHGLAVLLVASTGFWMILSSPFRQRRQRW